MSDDEECPMPHVTSTFHTGAAFEAGLVGHRNARGVERQEPSDGTQEEVVIGGHGLGGSAGCSGRQRLCWWQRQTDSASYLRQCFLDSRLIQGRGPEGTHRKERKGRDQFAV